MTEPDPSGRELSDDDKVVALAYRLLDMARTGDTAMLVTAIDAGAPPNLTDPKGDTLLMLAAYHGHADTVLALVERGADVDRANDSGQTPLAGAVFKQERDVVRALLAAGADPDAGQPSARQTAAMFDLIEIMALLDGTAT